MTDFTQIANMHKFPKKKEEPVAPVPWYQCGECGHDDHANGNTSCGFCGSERIVIK